MRKFEVTVVETIETTYVFEIEANNQRDAVREAKYLRYKTDPVSTNEEIISVSIAAIAWNVGREEKKISAPNQA